MKRSKAFSILLFLIVFLLPVVAYADDENPVTKMKSMLKFNWKVLDGLGFLFYIIMIPLTLAIIALLVWCIVDVVKYLIKVRRAKASLGDKKFWIELAITLLIVFLFTSGAFLNVLENVYDWTSKQDIGTNEISTPAK
ncbi:hypothetical protein MHH60_31815 [Paenibacillus sp. FSL H7-0716]|uniref:DUF3810 domain-containing protein n=1 Tax=Paenibacillus odorifer TaxID=189426 RepID=A0AB36J4F0_9BACL|nr:hypothetical protein [Paenibacillus odorifer]OME07459.1 hypothetical protein BSK60_31555 [Paenibacillus odorifer]OME10252.1 hypothetical protein BSK47_31005 [Paenibacillus odorifer]